MTIAEQHGGVARSERIDLNVIAGFVTPGARVLDVGCGDGARLQRLEELKQADGRGIELSQNGGNEAGARGRSGVLRRSLVSGTSPSAEESPARRARAGGRCP